MDQVIDIKIECKLVSCKFCAQILGQTCQPKSLNKNFYIFEKLPHVVVDEQIENYDLKAFTYVNEKFWELIRQETIPYALICCKCDRFIGIRIHAGSLAVNDWIQRDMLYSGFLIVEQSVVDLNEILES